MKRTSGQARVGLPYINNVPIVLITAAINLGMAFLFYYGKLVTWRGFVTDAAICGVTVSICDAALTLGIMNGMRKRGQLPRTVPQSAFMQRLPKNPALFTLVLAAFLGVAMAAIGAAVLWFFQVDTLSFSRFAVWKVVYSCLLSKKVVEAIILRYVQPDCAAPGDPEQTGADVVKNPLPRKDTAVNLFNTVVNDFGFNMLVGLLLGGTVVDAASKTVLIPPTTRSGIVISGLVLGVIVTLRMVYPVAKQIRAARDAGGLPPFARRSPWIAWLPENPAGFALALALPVMALSAGVLWAALTFFGFETLHFFQFFVVRTIYVTLLSKLVVALAVARYRQPGRTQTQGRNPDGALGAL